MSRKRSLSTDGRRERRLRRLARLVVRPKVPIADGPAATVRATVLRQFRRKAAAVGLSDIDLQDVMHRVAIHEVRKGRYLLLPGDAPPFVTVVGHGAIRTVVPSGVEEVRDRTTDADTSPKRRKTLQRLLTVQFGKPGYVVGLAPIGRADASRSFGAIAHCDSSIAEMSRDVILDVLRKTSPAARLMLVAYHCRALSRLIAAKCRLMPLPIPDRLRIELAELARAFPRPGHPGAIAIPLQHEDLASLVGTSRSTVAHAMRGLKDSVRVDREAHCYVVSAEALNASSWVVRAPERASDGVPADASERETFRASLSWAMQHVKFPRAACDVLLRGADLRAFAPGEVVAVNERLHATVLVSGAAHVQVRTAPGEVVGVWMAKPGHFIGAGWVSSAGSGLPTFRAVAHDCGSGDFCQVAILREDVLLQAMDVLTPEELLAFLGYCHDALSRQLYDRTVMLSLGNAERLLYQLHVLAADFPKRAPEGIIVDLPLSFRYDLAPLIATDTSGALHAKRDLVDAGRIKMLPEGRVLVIVPH